MLLVAARDLAAGEGFRVLRARGAELEREFAFGLVRQLVDAVVVGATDSERAALLDGPPGVATRLLGVTGPEGGMAVVAPVAPDPSFAVLHGRPNRRGPPHQRVQQARCQNPPRATSCPGGVHSSNPRLTLRRRSLEAPLGLSVPKTLSTGCAFTLTGRLRRASIRRCPSRSSTRSSAVSSSWSGSCPAARKPRGRDPAPRSGAPAKPDPPVGARACRPGAGRLGWAAPPSQSRAPLRPTSQPAALAPRSRDQALELLGRSSRAASPIGLPLPREGTT